MKLFDDPVDRNKNWLPQDGEVNYFGSIFSQEKADAYLDAFLENIDWKNDVTFIYGKKIMTKRKVAWYGNQPFEYTYSGFTKRALPWTEELLELKNKIEEETGEEFNSCLLNLYHDGSEGMGWHSDDESDLKKNGTIGSLSLGAKRKFVFKHKTTKEKVEVFLDHGSLLLMKGETQRYWLHTLPPTKKVKSPRVNLTFRTIEK